MTTHKFTADPAAKTKCAECGKSRNTAIHGYVKPSARVQEEAPAQVDTGMTEDEQDAAIAEDEIAAEDEAPAPAPAEDEDLIGDTRTNEQVESDAAQAEHDQVDADNAAEAAAQEEAPAPAKTAARRIPADTVGSFWLGWRVAEVAAQGTGSLAAKVQAAKPTQLRYYRVHLTLAEIKELDAIAEKFEEPGNTGYAIRASRTLRIEIAKVLKAQA